MPLVAIAAVFLHLAHDGGELFGARARFLVEVPDEYPADDAGDERIRQKAEWPLRKPRQIRIRRLADERGKRGPKELDPLVHQEEERPHERARKRARHDDARKEKHAVDWFGEAGQQLQIVGGERMQRKHLTIFGAVSTSERARRRATSANEWRENAAPCRQLRVLRVANPVVCSRLFCGKRASSRKGRPEPKRAAFGCYSTSQGIVISPTKPFIYALRKNVVPTDSPFDLRVIPCVSGLKNV